MYTQYQSYQQQASNSLSSSQRSWNSSTGFAATHQQQSPATTNIRSIPHNAVAQYTKYYHGWEAHGKVCMQQLKSISIGNIQARQEAQRRVDWAKYYSDLSSRAAHHFFQNPNATTAPFDLPPEPPKKPTAPQVQHESVTQQLQRKKDDAKSPGSLTRYVRNNIDRCSTQEQKKLVQAEIEKKIATAIQQGDLHSRNWDTVPLIPVPGAIVAAVPQYAPQKPKISGFQVKTPKKHKKHANNYMNTLPQNTSYYGHASSSSEPADASSSTAYNQIGNSSSNYYGPSSHSNTQSTFGDVSSFASQNRNECSPEEFIPLQSTHTLHHNSKKRKQMKGFQASKKVLVKRATRFAGPGGIAANTTSIDGYEKYMGKGMIGGSSVQLNEEDYEQMTVKGRCVNLEKEYLRLTAPPRADLVRPVPILKVHLKNLKESYALQNRKEYIWFCSQLKAIRQDCTVQRIQNEFAMDVYETHARIALKEGDLNEYNQCQTQLLELYQENNDCAQNQEEFIAYRLLYYIFLSCNEKYEGGSSDQLKIMLSLTSYQRSRPAIAHALKVREAMASGDYLSFFRLLVSTPNLGHHLTSLIIPTMRLRGLRRMAKAYRPALDIQVCIDQLGFGESVEEGKDWLIRCGCVVDGSTIIMKDSVIKEPEEVKKNSLI